MQIFNKKCEEICDGSFMLIWYGTLKFRMNRAYKIKAMFRYYRCSFYGYIESCIGCRSYMKKMHKSTVSTRQFTSLNGFLVTL
jgi:hypothetical protein